MSEEEAKSRLQQPDEGPMARFREFIGHPGALEELVQRVVESEDHDPLKSVAKALGIPYSKLCAWLIEDRVRNQAYADALQFRAETLAQETIGIADNARPEDAAGTKVRIQARQWLAARYNRTRYGDHSRVDVSVKEGPALDQEALALETARNILFLITHGEEMRREREAGPLALPAPVRAGSTAVEGVI